MTPNGIDAGSLREVQKTVSVLSDPISKDLAFQLSNGELFLVLANSLGGFYKLILSSKGIGSLRITSMLENTRHV